MPSPVAEAVLELLYPTRCAGCDRPGALLCDRCRAALPLIERTRACLRCGAPEGFRWCGECPVEPFAFEAVRCAGVLEPPLSRMVRLHKDADEWRLAEVLGALAADAVGDWADWIEAVVPVPARPSAVARRGYDHGSAIAAVISAHLGVPALDALLASNRRDQRGLSRRHRRRNASRSIVAAGPVSVPTRVLLVDDVFTTGSTLDAAARALRGAGAAQVRGVTVARAG